MPSFQIPDGPTTIQASRSADATAVYNVTNISGDSCVARLSVVPSGDSRSEWFGVDGDRERTFAPGETQTATVRVKFPADAPAGEYRFRLRAVAVNDPDNDHAEGAVTVATLGPSDAGGKKPSLLWLWILLGVIAVALIAGIWWFFASLGSTDDEKKPEAALPPLKLSVFWQKSPTGQRPMTRLAVPAGYKIIGGGCRVTYSGAGALLYKCAPENDTWVAAAKDHNVADPSASVEAWAIAIEDPGRRWDVIVQSATGSSTNWPTARAELPQGYVLTGGGGSVNWTGTGNLLTASFPDTPSSWTVKAKDHQVADPSTATAYVIGIRPAAGGMLPTSRIVSTDESTLRQAAHPQSEARVDLAGYAVVGGGARDDWQGGAGNMLTASYPLVGRDPNGRPLLASWHACGKDHLVSSPASITSFAVALSNVTSVSLAGDQQPAQPRC